MSLVADWPGVWPYNFGFLILYSNQHVINHKPELVTAMGSYKMAPMGMFIQLNYYYVWYTGGPEKSASRMCKHKVDIGREMYTES